MSPRNITIIGSLNYDIVTTTPLIPRPGETLTATSLRTLPGGKGANQALAVQRLSHKKPAPKNDSKPRSSIDARDIQVRMIGAVGADDFRHLALSMLQNDGVDVSGVRVVDGETTGVALVLVESEHGENRILLKPGANHSLRPEDFLGLQSLTGGSFGTSDSKPDLLVLQLEIPPETVEQIVATAKREGIDVLLNPAPAVELRREVYKGLTHLILNETEAAMLAGKGLDVEDMGGWGEVTDRFLRKGVRNVVVTLGAKGAYFSDGVGKGAYVPAEKGVRVVDTTGAGDTFVGAYAVEVVREKGVGGWDIRKAVEFTSRAAGRAVERGCSGCDSLGG